MTNEPAVTLFQLKGLARQLRVSLRAQGIEIAHSAALERVAKQYGFRNFNTANALLSVRHAPAGSPPAEEQPTTVSLLEISERSPRLDGDEAQRLRELLQLEIDGAHEFRAAKALEYPNDRRNGRSAEALRQLAEEFQSAAQEDLGAALYAVFGPDGPFAGGGRRAEVAQEEQQRLISRWGFNLDGVSNLTGFLKALTALAGANSTWHESPATLRGGAK